MPSYDYYCEENGQTIEVVHSIDARLQTWGEVCYVAQMPLGRTDPGVPVRKVFRTAPGVAVPIANSQLKNHGFTKLIKRDDGVYENVTAQDGEKRYMQRDDPASLPHLHKKIGD